MANFGAAFDELMKTEGGYVDDPTDRGGTTKYGVTIRTLAAFRQNVVVSKLDVQNLELTEAQALYKTFYWDKMQLDRVESETIAYILFDQAVNRGVSTIIKQTQSVLREMQFFQYPADGVFGPLTLGSLNAVFQGPGPSVFLKKFIKRSYVAYAEIAVAHPDQLKFLVGWINRTNKLLDLV